MGLFKPNVEKMKEQKDFPGLLKALRSRDETVQEEAREALGAFSSRDDLNAIINLTAEEELRNGNFAGMVFTILKKTATEATISDLLAAILKHVCVEDINTGHGRAFCDACVDLTTSLKQESISYGTWVQLAMFAMSPQRSMPHTSQRTEIWFVHSFVRLAIVQILEHFQVKESISYLERGVSQEKDYVTRKQMMAAIKRLEMG